MFQFRRFAALLLGAWLAGSVLTDFAAIQNFRSVDRFLADSSVPAASVAAAENIHTLGRAQARVFLRHLASEQNRYYFEHWEYLQLALGLAFLLVLVFGERPPKLSILLALGMLAIVLGQRAGLTPQITRLGRVLDYLPPETQNPDRKAFWTLHGLYSALELGKLALGLAIAALLLFRRNPDRKAFLRESELADMPLRREG